MFIALSFGLLLGCGGGGGSGTATVPQSIGTQPGSYSVTVTASSGAVSHTQVVKLTVQ